MQTTIRYLCKEDIIGLGALDMAAALRDIEQTFVLVYKDDAIVPEKTAMGFGKSYEEESTKGRINCMPGYLGGEFNMAGIKWVGSNPQNIAKGLPRASAITILNDPDTKFPVCVLDGTEISAVRTGAASGVAAKYLAKKDARNLLLIGAGHQNTKQLEAILLACPTLQNITVCDLMEEYANGFAREMSEKLKISITPVCSLADVPQQPDICVAATSASKPVIDDLGLVGKGCLHIAVGGLDHPDLYKKADKIVCDAWNQVRHRASCYLAMDGLKGLVRDEDIYAQQLGEIVAGDKLGRESDDEIIYFKPVGMGVEDIAIGSRVYKKAMAEDVGVDLRFL